MTKTREQIEKEYEAASSRQGFSYGSLLGIILNSENNSEEEKAAAFKLLEKKATEYWIADAQYYLSLYYKDKGENALALDWCTSAAYQGNQNAQAHLASLYQNGIGVSKDDEMARFWIAKISQKELPKLSPRIIGFITEEEITQSLKKQFYTEIADENTIPLAERYEKGLGAIRSEEIALKYYEESDSSLAKFRRALYYIKSQNTEQHAMAFELFKKACDDKSLSEKDRAEAKLQMAICYKNGKGTPKDELMASDYYMDAAYAGSIPAQLYLIDAYQKGDKKGLDKNYTKALYWTKVVAQTHYKNNPIAAGNFYEKLEKNIADDLAKSSADKNLAEKQKQLLLSRRRAKYWYDLATGKTIEKATGKEQQEAEKKLTNYADCEIDKDEAFREPPLVDEYLAQECKEKATPENRKVLLELARRYEEGNGVVKNPDRAKDIKADLGERFIETSYNEDLDEDQNVSLNDPTTSTQKRSANNLAQSSSKRTHQL